MQENWNTPLHRELHAPLLPSKINNPNFIRNPFFPSMYRYKFYAWSGYEFVVVRLHHRSYLVAVYVCRFLPTGQLQTVNTCLCFAIYWVGFIVWRVNSPIMIIDCVHKHDRSGNRWENIVEKNVIDTESTRKKLTGQRKNVKRRMPRLSPFIISVCAIQVRFNWHEISVTNKTDRWKDQCLLTDYLMYISSR